MHIPATISSKDQVPYIGKKGILTQNITTTCNFDKQFIFAIASWECCAHGARIFLTAGRNPIMNFPKPSKGISLFFDICFLNINIFLYKVFKLNYKFNL